MIIELMEMMTDYLLAFTIIVLYKKMREDNRDHISYFRNGFLLIAVAAITGGTYHGLVSGLNEIIFDLLWLITLVSVLIANSLFLFGLAQWSFHEDHEFARGIQFFAIVKTVGIGGIISVQPDFIYIAIDYGITFTTILIVRGIIWDYFGRDSPDFPDLIRSYGIALTVAFVWFQQTSVVEWFNYNALAHILQIGVMFYIYQALIHQPQVHSSHRFLKR